MINQERLEELGLHAISLRVSGGRKIDYIQENFDDWIDADDMENKYVIAIEIKVLGCNFEDDEHIKIGELDGYFFETELERAGINFYDLCDSISSDLEMMASAIIDEHEEVREEFCGFDENLMYIDRVYVEEKYRGLGIASYIIENINKILKYSINLSPQVLILLPMPQEKSEEGLLSEMKNEQEKKIHKSNLIKLYKGLGFDKIGNTEYMIKKITAPMNIF